MFIVIMKLLKSVLLWFKGELYFKEEEKILKLKLKLAKGEKLTPEEEKMILERDPEGYQMAVMIRNMKNKKENNKISSIQDKAEENYMEELHERAKGVSLEDTELKGCNTVLNGSFLGEKAEIGEISTQEFFRIKVE